MGKLDPVRYCFGCEMPHSGLTREAPYCSEDCRREDSDLPYEEVMWDEPWWNQPWQNELAGYFDVNKLNRWQQLQFYSKRPRVIRGATTLAFP